MWFRATSLPAGGLDFVDTLARDADPATLRALSHFFTRQAKRLDDAAHDRERRIRDNANARRRAAENQREFLRIGARLSVIARRYGNAEAAASEMRNRTGMTAEQIARAGAAWRREKERRQDARRNLAIWKRSVAGEDRNTLARAYGITPRQVNRIISDVERRAHFRLIDSGASNPLSPRAST